MADNMDQSGEFTAYTVGKPFQTGVTRWPAAVHYNFVEGQHALTIFTPHLSAMEKRVFGAGRLEFSFLVFGDVLLFHYSIGPKTFFGEAPYSWHMNLPSKRVLPPALCPGEMPFIRLMLIDSATGILETMRVVSLEHTFALNLHQSIEVQAKMPFDQSTYDRHLAQIFRQFTSQQLAVRAVHRCVIAAR